MAWRVAACLLALRDQVNAAHPDRSKASDGTIGDASHAASVSDHNPDSTGVVRALDITHDPAHGVDIRDLAEALRVSRDPRIKYVIANGRMFSSYPSATGVAPFTWRPYSGADPHTNHVHVSVVSDRALAESVKPWALTTTQEDDDMSAQDVKQVNDYTRALLLDGYTVGGEDKPSVLDVLVETQRRVTQLLNATSTAKIKAAVAAALPADLSPDVDVDALVPALAKAIVVELGKPS